MHYPQLLLLGNIFFLIFVCCSPNKKQNSNISDKIVLHIGPVEITEYEFEKNQKRAVGEDASTKEKQDWCSFYIERIFLLVDAYEKKYDTIGKINRMVEYAAKTKMARPDEYLWNYSIKPKLTCNNREIKEAYKKRNSRFNFEFILFPDRATMDSVLDKYPEIRDTKDFDNLYKYCEKNNKGKVLSQYSQWPFDMPMYEICDIIFKMEPGEITKPLETMSSFFIINLINKENIKQKPLKKEKDTIKELVFRVKSLQYAGQTQKEIKQKAKTIINYQLIDEIYPEVEKDFFNWTKAEKITQLKNQVVMQYDFKGKRIDYTLAHMVDYYENNPLLLVSEKKEYFYEMLSDIIIQEYLFDEAIQKGVTKDLQYILDRRNLMNNLMISRYEDDEFSSKIKISRKEIETNYRENLSSFRDGTNALVTVLYFNSQVNAAKTQNYLSSFLEEGRRYNLCDSTKLEGLLTCKQEEILVTDKSVFPDNIVKMIFNMPDNTLSIEPLVIHDKYILIYKNSETGSRIKTLEEAEKQINKILKTQRFIELRNQRLNEIKKKYPIDVNTINQKQK